MENKKLDLNSIIGFALIFGILIWIMYANQPTNEEIAAEKAKNEQVITNNKADVITDHKATTLQSAGSKLTTMSNDSTDVIVDATPAVDAAGTTVLENDLLKLTIANRGGYIVEAVVKNFERFEKGSGQVVKIITDNNANLNIKLQSQDKRLLETKDMLFVPTVNEVGGNKVLTMRLKAGSSEYIDFIYVLKPNDYMLDFDIKSQGLSKVIDVSKPLDMEWSMKTYRNEKSVSNENRYSELVYEYEGGKDDYLGQGQDKTVVENDVTYIAFKQHFFTSILLTNTPFAKAEMYSNNLVDDVERDTIFTKSFKANIPLAFKNGDLSHEMNWYYGPADYKILNSYKRNLDEIVPLGWGIFGWINKFLFIPAYGFLSMYMSEGLAIILFTILIKLILSPITYKSFLSQAKMKVLRPEIAELNEKYSKEPMKKQQETMKLYGKAGVNPMAGCIPALLQMPVFYALFQFFPSEINLRQQGFLWADDLSSFDSVAKLPFYIPLYGDHISVFPILASIAIFFYMKMTTGDQAMAAPPQEGMPDMQKIMKVMIYISPLMMLLFFNSYASGLSLYYFISNAITIGIMLVIKNYIIDSDKIHARIQENKLKEKPQSKFQKKMQEMMQQAEEQKKLKK
ncbi:membrane protein insertase YidC [Flavobacterium ardleyense]|uniref:membrane protein insertase YidC n=1 Tax=Flavobacterium ardleyense TaxID=2038737 RepID=UPI00298C1A30|nr:membrane protein insertase YidC [Flavobacterium ardleyense]